MTNYTCPGLQSYSPYFTELIAISQATQDILITSILIIVLLLIVILIIKLI